jgi:hypothetical protein
MLSYGCIRVYNTTKCLHNRVGVIESSHYSHFLLAWWECAVTSQTLRRQGASALWKERNARLFDNRPTPIAVILDRIKMEIDSWVAADAKELGSLFCE